MQVEGGGVLPNNTNARGTRVPTNQTKIYSVCHRRTFDQRVAVTEALCVSRSVNVIQPDLWIPGIAHAETPNMLVRRYAAQLRRNMTACNGADCCAYGVDFRVVDQKPRVPRIKYDSTVFMSRNGPELGKGEATPTERAFEVNGPDEQISCTSNGVQQSPV